MTEAINFPTLYGKNARGGIKVWRTWVERKDDGTARINQEYGVKEGKMQSTGRNVLKGKNIGRSNETTPWEQAAMEAEALWKKKWDENYREHEDDLEGATVLLPMLAQPFSKRSHDIVWPAYLQPKLNGVRCVATVGEGGVEYRSRKGKEFNTLTYLTPYLVDCFPPGTVIDGELFHADLGFQDITRRVKRQKTSREDIDKTRLQYWIFDLVDLEQDFVHRGALLRNLMRKHREEYPSTPLIEVETIRALTLKEFNKAHRIWVGQGFEGTIVRNSTGLYVPDYRSKDLQKHKDFVDKEFKIIGGKEGQGKDERTVIFTCVTEDGKEFDVRPKGTHAQRSEWWYKLDDLLCKHLTVRYQERSEDGVPIFPVGLGIRDYE